MIKINSTDNLAGISISGDYDDMERLVDAFYAITVDQFDRKKARYVEMSTRVLGLCYDIRHAMQGDREIDLVANGMNEEKMKWHSTIAPRNNVYYKCNYLYPEMFFVTLALNELIKLRMNELAKTKYLVEPLHKQVIWDETIAILRLFQAEFMACVREVLSEAAFRRWIALMNNSALAIENIAGQYIDLQNIKYLEMSKEKRCKNLSIMAKRIADFAHDRDHTEIKAIVVEAAKLHDCAQDSISLVGLEYPDEIEW